MDMTAKKLGFGLMRLPTLEDEAKSIDIPQLCDMVDSFLEQGYTYFDTAWMYCNFSSEKAIKKALVERHPRDSYTLATKLHVGYVERPEDRDRIFNTQLENTGVDYFDYYLLHSLSTENLSKYDEYDCWSWIADKKKQGLIKHVGFSFHDNAEVLDSILTAHPEMEFVQLQINYLDWDSDSIQSRLCYETARRHGKPVIVMEPVKGGTLAALPTAAAEDLQTIHPDWSPASWAVRFAASLPGVFMVLSGMSNRQQLADNTAYMHHTPKLDDRDMAAIHRTVATLNSRADIPCTGCAYCVDGCPMNIPIPRCFSLYNADLQEVEGKGWLPQEAYYDNLTLQYGKAGDCIACGHCEAVCPQHIPIIDGLKKVADHFGK